ncbi:MAG: DUF177 domain-containing protein [Rhodospirillaceae bacterium]
MTVRTYPAVILPEFSRPLAAESLPNAELVREIAASPGEAQALARRLELVAIGSLIATIRLCRVEGGRMVRVCGKLTADVVQSCVVTLEPVPAHIEESFSALFAPPELLPDSDGVIFLDTFALEQDQPEAMEGGIIDIGELTTQHLSLALDPYPRCPGTVFAGFDDHLAGDGPAGDGPAGDGPAESDEAAALTPFAVLAELKRR